jgi:integrase
MEELMLIKGGRRRRADGGLFKREDSQVLHAWYRDQKGRIRRESTGTTDQAQAERFLRDRLDARDDGRLATVLGSKQLTFNEWADWFLERRSKPPFRTAGTHQQNTNAMKFLRPVFGNQALGEITAETIEDYLAQRLECGRRVHTKFGIEERGKVKPATVHQEFRILSHMLNVAVKQKRLSDNPCRAVEFPVSVAKSTRKPHYMTASEQAKIEFAAPGYLRNIVVILCEMGLRPKKELLPMKKEQVDLENEVIHIADSKTVNGIGDMPMTPPAREAFARQMAEAEGSEYLFPTPKLKAQKPHMTNLRKVWANTLKRAGVPYFAIYELRHTFATRLSAGGVADHMVTQMLRQGDADVFKLYSQAKLGMMREALAKLDRQANEREGNSRTVKPN